MDVRRQGVGHGRVELARQLFAHGLEGKRRARVLANQVVFEALLEENGSCYSLSSQFEAGVIEQPLLL